MCAPLQSAISQGLQNFGGNNSPFAPLVHMISSAMPFGSFSGGGSTPQPATPTSPVMPIEAAPALGGSAPSAAPAPALGGQSTGAPQSGLGSTISNALPQFARGNGSGRVV